MSISMYELAVPLFQRGLAATRSHLQKGLDHATDRGFDPANLLRARLYPDMFDLTRQVQVATDTARRGAARLAGLEPPSVPDTEQTFDELFARLDSTTRYLAELDPRAFDDAADRELTVNLGQPFAFTGRSYLLGYALPNFLFHVTTAYDILRHNGVELGKRDFLTEFIRPR